MLVCGAQSVLKCVIGCVETFGRQGDDAKGGFHDEHVGGRARWHLER